MTSFSEILNKARQDVNEISDIKKNISDIKTITEIASEITSEETNIDYNVLQESKTEIKSDINKGILIGQAIMLSAKSGLSRTKKLRATNKCKRIAKNFISGECKPEHLIKAHKHIERLRNKKHNDFLLCGGWGTIQLFEEIEKGTNANDALQMIYKGPINEETK